MTREELDELVHNLEKAAFLGDKSAVITLVNLRRRSEAIIRKVISERYEAGKSSVFDLATFHDEIEDMYQDMYEDALLDEDNVPIDWLSL